MSDSDNDNSAAIDKAVDAFRAQREQGKASAPEADTDSAAAAAEPTPVTKLDDSPTPRGGGSSDAPTKAFKIPAALLAEATANRDADKSALVEQSVVGEPLSTEPAAEPAPGEADPDEAEAAEADATADTVEVKNAIVEQAVELPSHDAAPTKKIAAEEVASAAAATAAVATPSSAGSDSPTVPIPTPKQPAEATPAGPTPAEKPAPQVVAPAQATDAKRGRGKLAAILAAVAIVIVAIAVGLWYALVGSSTEHKVADAAKSYQDAMASGDLGKLRDVTCGEENAYYAGVSDADFAKAVAAQKNRNQLMTFDDVKAVQVNGDTARVGVDMYPSGDPAKTVAAQITLHNVGGSWKVCKQP